MTHGAVSQMIRILEAKGWLRRDGRYGRRLHLRASPAPEGENPAGMPVPIVGRIAAGLPLYAQQQWDGEVVGGRRPCFGGKTFSPCGSRATP